MYEASFTAQGQQITLGGFVSEQYGRQCLSQLRDLGLDLRNAQVQQATDASPTGTTQVPHTDPQGVWSKQTADTGIQEGTTIGAGRT